MVTKRRVLALAVFALLVLVACKQLDGARGSGCSRLLGRSDEREQAAFAAWDFRELSVKGYAQALAEYADAPVRARLVALEDEVWPVTDPKFGWGYLLGTSVLCAGGMHEGRVPMAFYHPWSDVFFVVLWKQEPNGQRIEDLEVLTGDFVRRQDKTRLRTARGWTEQATYGAYAVGFATSESTRAFERLFSTEELARGGFRSAANGLSNEALMEANHLAAGKQLLENLSELAPIVSKAPDPTGEAVQYKLAAVTDQIVRGQASALVAEATRTPEASKKALAALSSADWRRFKLVSFVKGADRSLVMLSHGEKPDLFVGLLLTGEGKSLVLKRVDLLSFRAFVENADSLKRESTR